jgi:hypothetical protein
MTTAVANPAHRGDLAVLVRTVRDFYTDRPAEERTAAVICVVTSITREGLVSKVRDNWGSTRALAHGERALVLGKDRVDVEAAWAAGCGHVYPGHDTPRDFDSVETAREAVRPFLRPAGGAVSR